MLNNLFFTFRFTDEMTSAKKIIQEISNCLMQRGPHPGPWKVVLIEPLKFGSFFLKSRKDFKR